MYTWRKTSNSIIKQIHEGENFIIITKSLQIKCAIPDRLKMRVFEWPPRARAVGGLVMSRVQLATVDQIIVLRAKEHSV